MTRTRQSLEMYDGVYISIYIYIRLHGSIPYSFILASLGVARRSALNARRCSSLGLARRSGSRAARGRSPLGAARRRSASLGVARRRSASLGAKDFTTSLPTHSLFPEPKILLKRLNPQVPPFPCQKSSHDPKAPKSQKQAPKGHLNGSFRN